MTFNYLFVYLALGLTYYIITTGIFSNPEKEEMRRKFINNYQWHKNKEMLRVFLWPLHVVVVILIAYSLSEAIKESDHDLKYWVKNKDRTQKIICETINSKWWAF